MTYLLGNMQKTLFVFAASIFFNKINQFFLQMMPSFSLYGNFHLLSPPEPYMHAESHSQRSRKRSSRKGSTDIDSKTKFKTEVCRYWGNGKTCPFGENCNFAHGEEEVRAKESLPSGYRTRNCHKFIDEGYCPYGKRCQFIHPQRLQHVHRTQALSCLAEHSEKFFAFLEEREKNSGRVQRLRVFEGLGEENGQCKLSIHITPASHLQKEGNAVQNLVDIRARHNSF